MQLFKFSWVFPGKDRRVGEYSVFQCIPVPVTHEFNSMLAGGSSNAELRNSGTARDSCRTLNAAQRPRSDCSRIFLCSSGAGKSFNQRRLNRRQVAVAAVGLDSGNKA